jgi:hypothetical protein
MDRMMHGVRYGFLAATLLLGLAACTGKDTQEPQTGNLTLCRDKVAELSLEETRFKIDGMENPDCAGCKVLRDSLADYDCVSVRATASGTFHHGGTFSQVGVYEGMLDISGLQILEWRSKRSHF